MARVKTLEEKKKCKEKFKNTSRIKQWIVIWFGLTADMQAAVFAIQYFEALV